LQCIKTPKPMEYSEFIKQKRKSIVLSGFDVDESAMNPMLFDFQRWIVLKACKAGKYAIFADCGLGKTLMQLEWARLVSEHTGMPVLILCPLAVAGQTIKEGEKFGILVERLKSDVFGVGVYITNYDQLPNINPQQFAGIVLDESSILKNFDGATKSAILDAFAHTPYKLACTATPSPNDPMELGNHSEFLGVMGRNEMLAMYFVHDGGETAKWRIKGHATSVFYQWVSTWAVMLAKPSDIGFSAIGYDLPELKMIEKTVIAPKRDNGQLFNDTAVSATDFNAELRITKIQRMDEVAAIVNNSTEPFIIWIKQDEEGEMIRKMIPDAVEVKGSDKPELKESRLLGFGRNEFRVLVTKTKIAQFGLNYQHCRNQVFASLDFSFEGLYQAIRRSYRFGQTEAVNIFIITTDTMQNVVQTIHRKQQQFTEMQKAMTDAVCATMEGSAGVSKIHNTDPIDTDLYRLRRGDCVQLIQAAPDNSWHFSVFSPPFASLYTYSDHDEDMGNCADFDTFTVQFRFLVRELARVVMRGRNVAVHCMDLPIQKGKEGFIGLRDFSGMILRAFEDEGFVYHSRVTIWKDPVTEMQRTKALGLLHKQVKKDSTMSRVGIPDYVLIFRNAGENAIPVTNTELSVDLWQKYASPVWMDIDYGNTLNNYRHAREENDEKHICPLQLDTIKRLIHLYTNKGEVVGTPFMGVGSEVYQAVTMGRKGEGFELKESYYATAKENAASAAAQVTQQSLF